MKTLITQVLCFWFVSSLVFGFAAVCTASDKWINYSIAGMVLSLFAAVIFGLYVIATETWKGDSK